MFLLRKSSERGFADHTWLKTWHSFSFAEYYDVKFMGFRQLRVINQDIVAPGQGFPTHSHRDMEIITVVLRGTIEHKDSMGNKELVKLGEIQRMSAGTGVQHSEFNPSPSDELELLQIWIEPDTKGIAPSYQQASIRGSDKEKMRLLVAPMGTDSPVQIHQDVCIYRVELAAHDKLNLPLKADRYAWLQITAGSLSTQELTATAGDGLAISREHAPLITAGASGVELLYFDLH
ncbi:MAG: pirin family protein [Proteobacteria bacterium]|nr:pirin family protein [Pseudomonadota bacterium]